MRQFNYQVTIKILHNDCWNKNYSRLLKTQEPKVCWISASCSSTPAPSCLSSVPFSPKPSLATMPLFAKKANFLAAFLLFTWASTNYRLLSFQLLQGRSIPTITAPTIMGQTESVHISSHTWGEGRTRIRTWAPISAKRMVPAAHKWQCKFEHAYIYVQNVFLSSVKTPFVSTTYQLWSRRFPTNKNKNYSEDS